MAVKTWENVHGGNQSRAEENFFIERDTLLQLDHPHIVKLFEVYETVDVSRQSLNLSRSLRLVSECCEGGELYNYIAAYAAQGEYVPGAQASLFARQMAMALHYRCRCGG